MPSHPNPDPSARAKLLSRGAALLIAVSFPFLAALLAARLAMTETFLYIEYTRPGFPADIYGFSTEDRMRYAPYAVNYLLNGEEISYLSDLQFDRGGALFNARELRHMRDVKLVTQAAFAAALGIFVINLGAAAYLLKSGRWRLVNALRAGAVLSLALILAIITLAVISWDRFFTAFHQLFFENGTWMFLYSDTLIRLFPEQFWFDAALWIGAFTVAAAGLTLLITLLPAIKDR